MIVYLEMTERMCSLLHCPWKKNVGASLQGYPKYLLLTADYSWYKCCVFLKQNTEETV